MFIGRFEFTTKADAERHIRLILSRYPQGGIVQGEDLELVLALLDQHPNREVIVGPGLCAIKVQHLGDQWGSRRFLACRIGAQESIRDFTWRHALYPRSGKATTLRACRTAVRDQIQQFRDSEFTIKPTRSCPVLGIPVTRANGQVDHEPPKTFDALVARWLKTVRLKWGEVSVEPSPNYQQPDRWEDPFLEQTWQDFHKLHAKLRIVSRQANLSTIRKQANAERND